MSQIRRIHPKTSWIVGDYTTGSSVEAIAERYGLEVEAVKAIVEFAMEERAKKRAEAKPYVAPPKKPKAKGRRANKSTKASMLPLSTEHTAWMPLDRLARLLGEDEMDLLWHLHMSKANTLGVECRGTKQRGLYRAYKPKRTI